LQPSLSSEGASFVAINAIRSATVTSITVIVAAVVFMLWLLVSLSAAEGDARAGVVKLLVADGGHEADATFETLAWNRSRGALPAKTTIAVLGGTYSLYAAVDSSASKDDVVVDVTDRGSGAFLGRFTLGGARSRGTLIVTSASILSFAVKLNPRQPPGRAAPHEVVIALVRPSIQR
jgi:hypothetical protein